MSSTDIPDPTPTPDDKPHDGLKAKITDAIDTVKERIHDYHEGPTDLD